MAFILELTLTHFFTPCNQRHLNFSLKWNQNPRTMRVRSVANVAAVCDRRHSTLGAPASRWRVVLAAETAAVRICERDGGWHPPGS